MILNAGYEQPMYDFAGALPTVRVFSFGFTGGGLGVSCWFRRCGLGSWGFGFRVYGLRIFW